MLWASSITVAAESIPDDCVVSEDLQIVATETIKIKDGAKPYKDYIVPLTNVEEALKYSNIKLGKYDTLNTSKKAPIIAGMKIKINRISYKKIVKYKAIKFKVKKKYTSKLYKGKKKVKCKGKKGKKKIIFTKTILNGKVVRKVISKEKVVKKPKNKVILIGTKRKNYYMIANNPTKFKTKSKGGKGTFRDHNGKKVAYKNKFTGRATAYSARSGATTSIGDTVHIGGAAVNPNQISYGSKMYIESPDGKFVYGYAKANDTGGFAYNGSGTLIDVFYPSFDDCCQFGCRTLVVYILL
jgi:3D (Asp-Asp-Asp) domain-containing protein